MRFSSTPRLRFYGMLFVLLGCCSSCFAESAGAPAEKNDVIETNGCGGCNEHRGAKTLLELFVGPRVEEEEDGEEEEEPLATDRPDFVEASSNVGRGRVQLEMGYTYIHDEEGGAITRHHSYPEILLRIGLLADWLELRIGQNFGSEHHRSELESLTGNGAEDLYLGIGLALTQQRGLLPESRVIVQTRVPTGSHAFGADKMLPGANLLYGWDVIPDLMSVAGSTQVNRSVDSVGHYHTTWAQAFTTGISLTDKLGMYLESFGIFPSGARAPDSGPEYYADGGFTYRITNNFQLDIRAGVGLNRRADDFFAGSGFAVRY
jgi:hypothetical protein